MMTTTRIDFKPVSSSRLHTVDFTNMVFGKVYSDHMFVADYLDGKWKDFRIEPYDLLKFTPGSAILHYGQSVFEGLKAYRNDSGDVLVFRPRENAKRLNVSSERMCIPEVPEELFMEGLVELLKRDKDWIPDLPDTSLYIRPYVFATDEYIGIRPSETYKFIIFTCPVGAYYSKPLKVKIETEYSRSVQGGTGYAKAAGNYAGSLYPARLAQEQGYDQLIWTDGASHSFIEEAGTMNIMFMMGDRLLTAATNDTVLAGITRKSVLRIARDWGMQVDERMIEVSEIVEGLMTGALKEAFGTGTAATITKIETIGHNGNNYNLPVDDAQSFSSRVLKELNDIRTGQKPDERGWVFKL
jgi:branched-chain amino acid aminotransferase